MDLGRTHPEQTAQQDSLGSVSHLRYIQVLTLSFSVVYQEGGRIEFYIDSVDNAVQGSIVKCHTPYTLSCVISIEIAGSFTGSQTSPSRAVLKLFDRRFAAQLRADQKIGAWTPEREHAFVDFVTRGEAAEFVRRLREDDDFEEPEEGWNDAENEAFLHYWCSDLYETEKRAYQALRPLQGAEIPQLFGCITVRDEKRPAGARTADEDLLAVKGLLLEYVPGPTLSELATSSVPREIWQHVVNQALTIIRNYSAYDILNKDVRPSNFVISESSGGYRVVMLDFALCEFRDDQPNTEWGRKKRSQDELGAIGMVMRKRLKEYGFELEYDDPTDWIEYAKGEDDD